MERELRELSETERQILELNDKFDALRRSLFELRDQFEEKENLQVKFKRLTPEAVIPAYQRNGDAGMDLVATSVDYTEGRLLTYGTGLSVEIPPGFLGLIFPRSSIRSRSLYLANSVGVIDSGFRGEIKVCFKEELRSTLDTYEVGERIAQLVILPFPQVSLQESEELSSTERGSGAFGSTNTLQPTQGVSDK